MAEMPDLLRDRGMSYTYDFDNSSMGQRWWFRDTYAFYQKGLKRLRTLLDEWRTKAGTTTHPYEREVRDLTIMIDYADDRLAQMRSDNDTFSVSGISVSSMRYLKAGATLLLLEKIGDLEEKRKRGVPDGVVGTMVKDIENMRKKADMLRGEPAECLWEVISRPDPLSDLPSLPMPEVTPKESPATTARRRARMKWDVFICHASEDKEDFVRPLAKALEAEGLRVWYDEFELTAGDGLLQSIDYGLARSRFGAVVLSHNFFQKSWPKKELDGLAAREGSPKNRKVILPVWHGLTRDEVAGYSPTIAGRIGIPTRDGVEYVVGELMRAIRKASDRIPSRRRKTRSARIPKGGRP